MQDDFFVKLLIGIPCILIALTIHEFFHGWTAWQFGDPTAKYAGRLTLNPISHLDPFGTAMLVITMMVAGMPLGWAKPVPVVKEHLANPRLHLPLVAFAGPLSNLVTAFLTGCAIKVMILSGILNSVPATQILITFFYYFVMVNIGLALFNLLPVPPLDGWNILQLFLPRDISDRADYFVRTNPAVSIILLVVVISFAGGILVYPFRFLFKLFIGGISF